MKIGYINHQKNTFFTCIPADAVTVTVTIQAIAIAMIVCVCVVNYHSCTVAY